MIPAPRKATNDAANDNENYHRWQQNEMNAQREECTKIINIYNVN